MPNYLKEGHKIFFSDKEWKSFWYTHLHWKNSEELTVKKEIKPRAGYEKKNMKKKDSLAYKGKYLL